MKQMKMMLVVMGAFIATVAFSGCGIPITIDQVFDVVDETVIPAGHAGLLTSGVFENNSSFCDIPSLEELRQKAVEAGIPNWLAKRVSIKSVEIRSLTFEAITGDFSTFSYIEDTLRADGQVLAILAAQSDGGFGSTVVLTPDVDVDLAEYISESNPTCLQNYLKIIGTLPQSSLTFKAYLDAKIVLRVRII